MSKNKFSLFLSVLILTFLLFGCTQTETEPEKQSVKVKLYFADAHNEDFLIEERQIAYVTGEEKYRLTLEELLKGSDNQAARNNIPENTQVYGIIKQKSFLIVNLSQDFNQFGGSMAEILGVGALVNTMTQFEEITRVKILVEGEEFVGPSGQPRGFMEPFL
jgi:germination protein M